MPPRSPIQARAYPGGIFTIVNEGETTGEIFFVHSGTGTDAAGYGQTPDKPLATLDYAVGLCTANKGDRIFLMPGHAETIAGATGCVLDIAGVEVIGMGRGALTPTFTLATATTATISVTAANCKIKNVRIVSDLADVAAGVTAAATADGLVLEDCEFRDGGATKELVIGVSLAAACDDPKIRRCKFVMTAAGDNASAVKFVGACARPEIEDCYFYGDWDAAAIDGATAAGTVFKIARNMAVNLDAGAGLAVSLHNSTTGQVVDNRLFGNKTNTVPLAAAGCWVAENYTAAAVNESGIIKPNAETYA